MLFFLIEDKFRKMVSNKYVDLIEKNNFVRSKCYLKIYIKNLVSMATITMVHNRVWAEQLSTKVSGRKHLLFWRFWMEV